LLLENKLIYDPHCACFVQDARSKWVVTADEGRRGARIIPLKATADTAVAQVTYLHLKAFMLFSA
jgi:acyl-coenzyme A synthetase/AMP-(fatty) acid ligase